MKAFEYLKSLIESVDNEWQFPKRRHRPPPLPVGPPDDNNILLFSSTQAFRIERKVDRLFPKLAELSALLSSGELAHSPAGWVTLNTLNAYTGRAVPGNFDPQSQTVVDSKPLLSHTNLPHSNSMTTSSKLSLQLMTKIGGVFKLAVTQSVDAKNWSSASHHQCLVAGLVLHCRPRPHTSPLLH